MTPPERRDPTDPAEWLRRARSNLARAEAGLPSPQVLYEDLAFDAQQAAEKALKAVLVFRSAPFPKTHSLVHLMTLIVDSGTAVPSNIREAARLTRFAVTTRYPGVEEVTEGEYREALVLGRRVVRWAEGMIRGGLTDREGRQPNEPGNAE